VVRLCRKQLKGEQKCEQEWPYEHGGEGFEVFEEFEGFDVPAGLAAAV
jgi:hypothetical protein